LVHLFQTGTKKKLKSNRLSQNRFSILNTLSALQRAGNYSSVLRAEGDGYQLEALAVRVSQASQPSELGKQ